MLAQVSTAHVKSIWLSFHPHNVFTSSLCVLPGDEWSVYICPAALDWPSVLSCLMLTWTMDHLALPIIHLLQLEYPWDISILPEQAS